MALVLGWVQRGPGVTKTEPPKNMSLAVSLTLGALLAVAIASLIILYLKFRAQPQQIQHMQQEQERMRIFGDQQIHQQIADRGIGLVRVGYLRQLHRDGVRLPPRGEIPEDELHEGPISDCVCPTTPHSCVFAAPPLLARSLLAR
jgi:hypothetical protein